MVYKPTESEVIGAGPKPLTLSALRKMKKEGEKIASLTAYDATFAQLVDEAGVELVLVGDSLGMVVQGQSSTVSVTLDHMVYHTKLVARGLRRAFLMADLPFLSFTTPEQAAESSARLIQEGNAKMVKLETTRSNVETVRFLARNGVPQCVHLGLLPQSVHKMGGYRLQGKEPDQALTLVEDARTMEGEGADILLLEMVPAAVARKITEAVSIPVIGIGAGACCDGQILVLQDMLGITPGKRPRFSRDFLATSPQGGGVRHALADFVAAVKDGSFPTPEESF